MNKIIEGIPYILLVALTPYLFFNDPNIAQAIIISAIAALSGYRYYLNHNSLPDYRKLFKDELREIKKENREFRDKYGKLSIEGGKKKPLENSFRW